MLQIIAARMLGLEGLGRFAILYGVLLLVTALVSGFIGDTLTVLDRFDRHVRFTLQLWCVGLSFGAAIAAAFVVMMARFLTPIEAVAFSGAIAIFVLEDTLRRTLMANLLYWKIVIVDLIGLLGALLVLGFLAATVRPSLVIFFLSILGGQLVALFAAVMLLPRSERFLVMRVVKCTSSVPKYGIWRAAQQAVRPGLLTVVRMTILVLVGAAVVGQVEVARIYVAPMMLVVSGASSFLFTSFARNGDTSIRELLGRADRAVLGLAGVSIVVGGLGLLLLPVIGHLVTGQHPLVLAVAGWIFYSISVSAVTPYGALAAVRGRQSAVLGLRVLDSFISFVLAVAVLQTNLTPALIPSALAVGSITGGLLIRQLLLVPALKYELEVPHQVKPKMRDTSASATT
ncbi:hypothetical protein [Arthrobacter alpinus]|uniref:hypothetical protein n=1 Tax=Arthrobacter alpinus TaxID=656366 RepID=UPI00101ADCC7|nr:hypothetical protein [Arthrobacter alpinus]